MENIETMKDQNLDETEASQSADMAEEVTASESADRLQLFAELEGEEDVSRRGENIKHFHLGGNRYQAVVYPEAVHYRKTEDDSWEEIDNNLTVASEGERSLLRNRRGPMRAEFPSVADESALVRLTRKGRTLSWRFERTMDSVQAAVKNGAELNMERLSALAGMAVEDMTLERAAEVETPQDRRFTIASKSSEVSYSDVLPGVSVRYSLTGARLKEDIILENKYVLEYAALILDGGMDYVLNEDQSITVSQEGEEESLFVFTPPVAWDANHAPIAVSPVLESTDAGTRLSYTIAQADLDAAVYPITIDPNVQFTNDDYIQDLTLTQGASVTATGNGTGNPYLKIGVSSSDENVALVRFLKLAKLKSSDTVISAVLRMAPKAGSSTKYVSAHEVKIPWNPKQINYDTFLGGTDEQDAANVAPDELDYSDSATSAYMIFDLTNIYRQWYEAALDAGGNPVSSKNYGIMLRKAARVSGDQYQEIYSSEASTTSNRPVFYVNYISHAGLEGWWQYESQSAGRAGTVHSDLFNGNMVLEHTDTQMNGNLAPVSLSHYYNSCLSKDNPLRCGYGWRHSGLQKVYEKTIGSTDYYVWVDGDGTEHWFQDKGDGNESKDLEGMQLKLTRYAATSTRPPRVEIVDKEHTMMSFRKRLGLSHTGTWNDYWLLTVADAHGNTASYTYEMPSNQDSSTAMRALEGKLIKITDGAGRETTLTYTNDLLTSINIPDAVDGSLRTVSYTYDSSSRLTGISYSELGSGTHTTYSYLDTTNLLVQATNFDSQRVEIGYEDTSKYWSEFIDGGADDQMRRVISLETQAVVGGVTTYGAKQKFEYKNMCTEVTVVENTSSDAGKKLIYQFNDSGNVTCVKDELGYAQFTKFSSSITNAPSESSKMQKAVINRLRMPDMSGLWTSVGAVSPNTVAVDTTMRCLGIPSVKITKGNASDVCYRQQVKLEPDKSWSLSAFIKTTGFTDGTGNVFLRVYDASDPQNLVLLAQSVPLTTLTPTVDDKDLPTDDWERLHLAFTPGNTSDINVYAELVNMSAAGAAYFACPQLEEGVVANSFNMVSNGDFRYIVDPAAARLMPSDWDAGGDMANDANAKIMIPANNANDEACAAFPAALGGNMLRVPGAPNDGSASFSQDINLSGASGDVFVLGGWANAKSAPNASTSDRGFRITLKFYTGGGTDGWEYGPNDNSKIPFNFEWVGWQYMTGVCTAPANYTKARVYAVYMKNINTANFTNIFVHREQFAKSFGYDSKKNITSIGNLAGKKSGMEYDDYDNLTSYKQPGRADTVKYTMTYGSTAAEQKKHRLLTSKTPTGMKQTFTYDSKGNQLTATTQKDGATALIKTRTVYTADQNYALERYDARGKKVSLVTNPRTGTLTSATDPKGTSVSYTYDGSKRVTSVQATADGKTYKNAYAYENDRLKTVSHNTTSDTVTDVTYTFDYDALGSQAAVKVGTQTLSTNVYEADRARNLQRVDYGNGGKVRYAYDPFDRLTAVSYDGSDPATNPRYKYEYGANGQTAQVTDTNLNRTQWAEYDQAMRPIQANTFANDANGKPTTLLYRSTLKYNKYNNLIKFQERANGADHTTEYNYDNDNRTTKVGFRFSGTIRGMEYGYDDVNRVATIKRGTAAIGSDKTIAVTENTALGTAYTYVAGDTTAYGAGATTPLVASIASGTDSNAMNFSYTYDDTGNILSETRDGSVTTYAYDGLGQLIRVNDPHQNATWTYAYDRGGNILNKNRYAYTTGTLGPVLEPISYTYGDSNWKDKLTSYNGSAITYDAIGNPTAYDGWTFTWQAGRQLTSMVKTGINASFKYDANGLRIQKTVNGVVTDYTLHGKLVTHLKQGSDNLHFFYDAQSRPAMVSFNGALYTYVHNLQGDIVAIVDSAGSKVVEYKYDAWGKPLTGFPIGTLANTLGKLNPFRYRGYVYDEETSLYYLRSRYYSSEWGRFINIDSVIGGRAKPLVYNLFAYCENNVIGKSDSDGHEAITATVSLAYWAFAAVATAIVAAVTKPRLPDFSTNINGAKKTVSEKVKWDDVSARRKEHTLKPSDDKHKWKERFDIDPNKGDSWEKILPIIKKAIDEADRIERSPNGPEIIEKYYKYFSDVDSTVKVTLRHLVDDVYEFSDAWVIGG